MFTWLLPESALNLVVRKAPRAQIAALLNRMGGHFGNDSAFILNSPSIKRNSTITELFRHGLFPGQSAIFFILALPAMLAAISIVAHRNVQLTMKIKGAGLGEIPALSETLNNR